MFASVLRKRYSEGKNKKLCVLRVSAVKITAIFTMLKDHLLSVICSLSSVICSLFSALSAAVREQDANETDFVNIKACEQGKEFSGSHHDPVGSEHF